MTALRRENVFRGEMHAEQIQMRRGKKKRRGKKEKKMKKKTPLKSAL